MINFHKENFFGLIKTNLRSENNIFQSINNINKVIIIPIISIINMYLISDFKIFFKIIYKIFG